MPDPETGERTSDADHARPDELFPVWRHHPFLTTGLQPAPAADITHRRHAIIETVFADLIDGPLAHLPSAHWPWADAWLTCGTASAVTDCQHPSQQPSLAATACLVHRCSERVPPLDCCNTTP